MTTIGNYGDGVRGDVRVTIVDGTPEIEITSSVQSMYGQAIRDQVSSSLVRFGSPQVSIQLEDSGALPFAIEARLETALAAHLSMPLPELPRKDIVPDRNRLRRSRLYVPGNSPKLLPNISLYGADGVILDLEDSVAPSEKVAARALVRRALHSIDFGKSERMVRINSGEDGLQDIHATARQGVETYLVPKAESVDDIIGIDNLLSESECPSQLILILESALGVHRAFDLAASSSRIVGIALGVEDYVASIHATKSVSGEELAWANGAVINAARAAGVAPLGSVFAKIDDDDGMESYARRMSMLGFEGVGCIHPQQIRPAHRGFTPPTESVAQARRIVDAYSSATESGIGAISVDGEMVDVPIYVRAQRVLAMAGDAL